MTHSVSPISPPLSEETEVVGHPRSPHDDRSELELCLRDAYAAGCHAQATRSIFTAAAYAKQHALIVAKRLAQSPPGHQTLPEGMLSILRECRDAIYLAVCGDDGFDDISLVDRVSDVLGDKEDFDASLKCYDEPCERCGEGSIRHVIKHGYAKYEGICDACHTLSTAPQSATT